MVGRDAFHSVPHLCSSSERGPVERVPTAVADRRPQYVSNSSRFSPWLVSSQRLPLLATNRRPGFL